MEKFLLKLLFFNFWYSLVCSDKLSQKKVNKKSGKKMVIITISLGLPNFLL